MRSKEEIAGRMKKAEDTGDKFEAGWLQFIYDFYTDKTAKGMKDTLERTKKHLDNNPDNFAGRDEAEKIVELFEWILDENK